eukprot:3084583-Amphidinium_carterae.1
MLHKEVHMGWQAQCPFHKKTDVAFFRRYMSLNSDSVEVLRVDDEPGEVLTDAQLDELWLQEHGPLSDPYHH